MPDKTPEPAMRLIFEYDSEEVRLVHQAPVTMVIPEANPEQDAPGVYVDSRNAANASLARVRAPEALSQSVEVFPSPSRPDERIHRIDAPAVGAFSVVVPAPQEADHVTVVRVAPADVSPPPAIAGIVNRAIAARRVSRQDGPPATVTDLAEFPLVRR
jgi:hypothetical protein